MLGTRMGSSVTRQLCPTLTDDVGDKDGLVDGDCCILGLGVGGLDLARKSKQSIDLMCLSPLTETTLES